MPFLQQKRVVGYRVVPRERQFLGYKGVMLLLWVVAYTDALLPWLDVLGILDGVYMVVQYPLFQDVQFLGCRGGR
jgi:hypothetical protein